jgi:hypothetical protein
MNVCADLILVLVASAFLFLSLANVAHSRRFLHTYNKLAVLCCCVMLCCGLPANTELPNQQGLWSGRDAHLR